MIVKLQKNNLNRSLLIFSCTRGIVDYYLNLINKLIFLIFSESPAEESCNPHTGRSHECPGRRIGKACSGLKDFSDRSVKLNTNYVRLGVSICLDVVSIETLDLDTEKKSVATAVRLLGVFHSLLSNKWSV